MHHVYGSSPACDRRWVFRLPFSLNELSHIYATHYVIGILVYEEILKTHWRAHTGDKPCPRDIWYSKHISGSLKTTFTERFVVGICHIGAVLNNFSHASHDSYSHVRLLATGEIVNFIKFFFSLAGNVDVILLLRLNVNKVWHYLF